MDQTTGPGSAGAGSSNFLSAVDFKWIIDRAKYVIMNPISCWSTIAGEGRSLNDLYKKYVIPLSAVPAICGFIGLVTVGISVPILGNWRAPFFPQLIATIVQYGLGLLMVYVGAIIAQKVASMSGGATDNNRAFNLVAYSMTPAWVGGILGIIPALGVIGSLFGIYSLYLFYQGATPMAGVPENQRIKFVALTVVGMFIVGLICGLVIAMVSPAIQPFGA